MAGFNPSEPRDSHGQWASAAIRAGIAKASKGGQRIGRGLAAVGRKVSKAVHQHNESKRAAAKVINDVATVAALGVAGVAIAGAAHDVARGVKSAAADYKTKKSGLDGLAKATNNFHKNMGSAGTSGHRATSQGSVDVGAHERNSDNTFKAAKPDKSPNTAKSAKPRVRKSGYNPQLHTVKRNRVHK